MRLIAAARVIAIMAFGTAGRHQINRVTIAAGSAAMTDSRSALAAVGWLGMRKIELGRRPGGGRMAIGTGILEQPSVESGVSVAGNAIR